MTMKPKAAALFAVVKDLHRQAVTSCKEMRIETDAAGTNATDFDALLKDYADLAYAMDKCVKYLEEVQKVMRQLGELNERIACGIIATAGMDISSINTDHVCAVPDLRLMATLPTPDKDPEGFALMMDDLGVSRHLWEGREHNVVKPHWPGLIEELSKRAAAGKPLPRGVDPNKTYPKYTLHLRGKKGPDEP